MRRSLVALLACISWTGAQSDPVPITGLHTGISSSGQRPARQNINNYYAQGGPSWDLYIQALAAFQARDQSAELSYYQIAGIHGLPFVSWNGVEQVAGAPDSGYCPHGELLFGTWHRPFVALYEQVLGKIVRDIASQYTGNNAPAYQAAAQSFRVPFWDWGNDYNLPAAAVVPTITINAPNGSLTMQNPLYAYQFQQVPVQGQGVGGPLAQDAETKRCPDSNGISSSAAADSNLLQGGLTSQVYGVFIGAETFEEMVTMASPGPSFEAPHNDVHNDVGGQNGHLSDINWSAFDPLFMLHHCNIDRYIALWQAINYNNSMFTTTGESGGQFATPAGTITTADSPLKPFLRDASGTFWTSRAVGPIRTFGYTYPEINDWSTTPAGLAAYVTAQVNQLYGTGSSLSRRSSPPLQRATSSSSRRWGGCQKDYSAEIAIERSDVPLPCTVNLVLNSAVVGRMTLLGMPTSGRAYANIPLRGVLEGQGMRDFNTVVVIPFLRRSLQVVIRKSDGTVVALDSVPSLTVQLQDQDFTPRTSDAEFPTFGSATKWSFFPPEGEP